MKKIVFLVFIPLFFTCTESPILSDLVNDRIQVKLLGTYESNDPYDWNTSLYLDEALTASPAPVSTSVSGSDLDMYLDIAEIRLATGTGITDSDVPAEYWTYFTRKREVFCSDNYTSLGKRIISCDNNNGSDNYADFFGEPRSDGTVEDGYLYPASDVPEGTYPHLAVFFRKFVTAPTYQYDASYGSETMLTTIFDNRIVDGTDLAETLLQYESTDTDNETSLLSPLQRTDLNLVIPGGNDTYVLEVRLFVKNLLMKHMITYGNYLSDTLTDVAPITFVGLSDWDANHAVDGLQDAFQMGGSLLLTGRVYDPNDVSDIIITSDSELPIPAFKSYYAVMPAGESFSDANGKDVLPYAATSRASDRIKNLPPGDYDLYKTCDKFTRSASGTISGEDGYPETKVSCGTFTVASGSDTNVSLTCVCP